MDHQSFEEQYLDVLQNLEFGIVQMARRHPEMSDWEALAAVEAQPTESLRFHTCSPAYQKLRGRLRYLMAS